jgi:hypothetical protein
MSILKNRVKLCRGVKRDISKHLRHKTRLRNIFYQTIMTIISSFHMEDFSVTEYEQLIDIYSDSVLKQKFLGQVN